MKTMLKRYIRPVLFVIGGMLAGLIYYYLVGCTSGSCAITSSPIRSMLYLGLIGWLLSGIFGRKCEDGCNM